MIGCRCAYVFDGGFLVVVAEDEAASRSASSSIPPASSSVAVDVVGGVVSRRLFVAGKCGHVVCKVVCREE